MNKRIHLYFPEEKIATMKNVARENGMTVSKLLRSLVAGCDTIRNYVPDGQHTQEKMTENTIRNILRRVAH